MTGPLAACLGSRLLHHYWRSLLSLPDTLVQCPMCLSLSCLSLHLWISSCSSVHLPLSATCQFLSLHFTLLLCLSSCWLPLFIVSAVILTALPVPVVAFVQNLISPVCPPVHKARLLGHPDSRPVSSYPLYIPALASLQALLLSNAIQSLQSHFIGCPQVFLTAVPQMRLHLCHSV